MSYDLMVFEPEAAPGDHAEFLEWYHKQTKWSEGHSYNDLAVTSAKLRAWIRDIQSVFPCLQEEDFDAPSLDESVLADYSIGRQVVYVAFSWPKMAEAYQTVFDLATKHQIGFFNVSSSEEEVWLPGEGRLLLAHKKMSPTFKDRLAKLFRSK